jgi:hypothetical protein
MKKVRNILFPALLVLVIGLVFCPVASSQETVLQPGPVDGVDVWVTNVYHDYGQDNEYLIAGGWGDYYYSLIKFNIDGLPANVESARIEFYCYNSDTSLLTPMYLDRVNTAWDESTRWETKPSYSFLETIPTPSPLSWYVIDITNIYRNWKNGTHENHGIQLRPTSINHTANYFYSSDYMENPNLRPKLVVRTSQEQSYVLPDTGLTECYDDTGEISCPQPGERFYGQDGNYVGHQPVYQLSLDGLTVTDLNTGLMWQQTDDGVRRNWYQAVASCEDSDLAGYTDWRLPSRLELITIVDHGRYNPSIHPVFTGRSSSYWSITKRRPDADDAFHINFSYGYENSLTGDNIYYVRCVRGENIPEVDPIDNYNGTVTDISTGLIWQQTNDGQRRTWEEALSYCENLPLAGETDWRLPNTHELRSIVNWALTNPGIDPVFDLSYTDSWWYWSGTTCPYSQGEAWSLDFSYGLAKAYGLKTNSNNVLCVRGPSGSSGGENQPPIIDSFTSNPHPATGATPLTVNFTCSARDPDGLIQGYEIAFGDGFGESSLNGIVSYTYNFVGEYEATCTAFDNEGAYAVSQPIAVAVNNVTNPCSVAHPMDVNTDVQGSLLVAGSTNYYRFEVPLMGRLVVYTEGFDDTYGELLNAQCEIILGNDNESNQNKNFKISHVVDQGTYYVSVRHTNQKKTGGYQLYVDLGLVTTTWDQIDPYKVWFNPNASNACNRLVEANVLTDLGSGNNKDTQYLVGCTAVAVGQLINYYFRSFYLENGYRLDWLHTLLENHIVSPTFEKKKETIALGCPPHTGFLTEAFYPDSIGSKNERLLPEGSDLVRFLWTVAVGLDTKFTAGDGSGTGFDRGKMVEMLRNRFDMNHPDLGFTPLISRIDRYENAIIYSVDHGHPILISMGQSLLGIDPVASMSHLALIDGYKKNPFRVRLNLGWGGRQDGWYRTAGEPISSEGYDTFCLFFGTFPYRPNP